MQSLFEKMGGTYTQAENGLCYPDLILPEEEAPHYGKFGEMRRIFLKEHRRNLYTKYLLSGGLGAHLNAIDRAANDRIELLVKQMAEKQHIDEELKVGDHLRWVAAMNNIRNAAEEIVLNELIYM